MHSSSKIIEVIGKLMVKFWVYLMKYIAPDTDTLYLCLYTRIYRYIHCICVF